MPRQLETNARDTEAKGRVCRTAELPLLLQRARHARLQRDWGCGNLALAGKKTRLFAPFVLKNDLLARTGSGQT